jgi:hypothetical protein
LHFCSVRSGHFFSTAWNSSRSPSIADELRANRFSTGAGCRTNEGMFE